MEPRIRVSDDERRDGRLTPDQLTAALAAFHGQGCVVLEQVFPVELIDRLHQGFRALYGDLSARDMIERSWAPGPNRLLEVGMRRFDIAMAIRPPFDDRLLYANPVLLDVLFHLLDAFVMGSFTAVVSFPGSPAQHVHRDHDHLYRQSHISTALPPFAVNISVPLVDVDLECGPTGFWPGSHRADTSVLAEHLVPVPLARGDCMMLDYRTVHCGTANRSTRVRPILYLVYTKPWFVDNKNHVRRSPLDVTLAHYERLSSDDQKLLVRGWIERVRRLDDGCPCGSGASFAACHGRR